MVLMLVVMVGVTLFVFTVIHGIVVDWFRCYCCLRLLLMLAVVVVLMLLSVFADVVVVVGLIVCVCN